MSLSYSIEDEFHSELLSEHETFEAAIAELKRLAKIPWDKTPNCAPCTSWKTCGRRYEIIEYETSTEPGTELRRVLAFEISTQGDVWNDEFSQE